MATGKFTPENFENYHKQNPEIWEKLVEYAFKAVREHQRKHFSVKAIMYIIRWFTPITDDQPDQFKINDGWISHYNRKLIREYPELADYFETRERRGSYHETPPPPPEITEQSSLSL